MKSIPLSLVLLTLVGCGGGLSPDDARPLILEAVTISPALLDEVTRAGAAFHPATASDFPFSFLVLLAPIQEDSDDWRSLRAPDAPSLSPREIWIDTGTGRLTLIAPEHLTEVTVDEEVEGAEGVVSGSFRWRRPNFVEARGTFRARRTEDAWEIVELGLPAAKASVALRKDGTWGLVDGR